MWLTVSQQLYKKEKILQTRVEPFAVPFGNLGRWLMSRKILISIYKHNYFLLISYNIIRKQTSISKNILPWYKFTIYTNWKLLMLTNKKLGSFSKRLYLSQFYIGQNTKIVYSVLVTVF